MSFGVTPAALAGHSIGELVAATVAGVFDLPTAIKVVSVRARLMHAAPAGAMVAVAANPDDIAEHLTAMNGSVDLAAINETGSCVVAGPADAIRAFTDRLAAHGILARRVRTSHGFHSRAMDAVLAPFAEYLSTVTLHQPRIPMLSNVTGTWMTDEEATDPNRWAQHVRSTVRFADEVQALLGDTHRVLVEVGPGGSLTGSAVRLPGWSDTHRAVRLMRHPLQSRDDRDVFLLGLGQLWSAGVDVDWTARHGDQVQRVTLPGYAFARQRHWIDPAHLRAVGRCVRPDRYGSRRTAAGGSQGRKRHRRPFADAGDAAADLVAVSGRRVDCAGRQLLRTGRRLALGDRRGDDRGSRRRGAHPAGPLRPSQPWRHWPTPSSRATPPAAWQARTPTI